MRYQVASLPTQFHKTKIMLIFITSHLSFEYHGINYTNATSNHIKLTYVTNGIQEFVKCIKRWAHLDLRPNNMLFGCLQPITISPVLVLHNQHKFLIKEGNVLFNDALNTFYLRLYSVGHMVKDHSDSERENPFPPHGLFFPINSKGYFICTIPQTE